jgi:hypothetical protein
MFAISHKPPGGVASESSLIISQVDIGDYSGMVDSGPLFAFLRVSKFIGSDPPELRTVDNDWTGLLREVTSWAQDVKAYNDLPDLWALGYDPAVGALSEAYEASDNRPFTEAEQAEIAGQIRQIKESIKKSFALSAEQIERVEARLDAAQDASRRMGRKDWLLLFSGAVLSLILTDIITPGVAEHILTMAAHGLGHLFGYGGPLIRGVLNK